MGALGDMGARARVNPGRATGWLQRRLALTLALAATAATTAGFFLAPAAHAAFQGTNGKLAVTRVSPGNPADPVKTERVTAARLILTTHAMADLCMQLKNILDQLEKQGAVTKHPAPTQALQ